MTEAHLAFLVPNKLLGSLSLDGCGLVERVGKDVGVEEEPIAHSSRPG